MERLKMPIEVGITKMPFRHEGKILTAVHPFCGPANSKTLQTEITKQDLRAPTFRETVSFVHEYVNRQELQVQEVRKIMKSNFFRGFTGILYDSKTQMAYFIDNPNFNDESIVDLKDLSGRVNESYAQVPLADIREGVIGYEDIPKNKYLLGLAGEEGAEKLSELALDYAREESHIWVPNVSNLREPLVRVASLDSSRDDHRLSVDGGDLRGVDDLGRAFGVLPSSEKTE